MTSDYYGYIELNSVPSSGGYGGGFILILNAISWQNEFTIQLWSGDNASTNKFYMRKRYNETWSSWKEL